MFARDNSHTQDNFILIPTKSTNCDKNTSHSFRIFFMFALERNYFRITAFCDKILDVTFVASVAKIFTNRIVYSFSVKHVPNFRKVKCLGFLVSLEI